MPRVACGVGRPEPVCAASPGASTVAVRCVDPVTGGAPTGTSLFWVDYIS
jgi:hypothetical protein